MGFYLIRNLLNLELVDFKIYIINLIINLDDKFEF